MALFALTVLFTSSHANPLSLQTSESPLTIYGIDFEHIDKLPACTEIDVNTDLSNDDGDKAPVLQPSPVACIAPHLTCKVGEWSAMTFTPTQEHSTRIQGRVQTPQGVRAIYAMHTKPDNTRQTERFEIGINGLLDEDIQTYLNAKYGQPDLTPASQKAMDVVAELRKKLMPDTFVFWQIEHQNRAYLVYYTRVGKRQMIGGVDLAEVMP